MTRDRMEKAEHPWHHCEQALVGGVLLDPTTAFWKVAGIVDDSDLAGDGHATIWRAVREVIQEGRQPDTVGIIDYLRSRNPGSRQLQALVIDLANNAPGPHNVVAYAELVVKHSEHRRIVNAGQRIAKLGPHEIDEAHRILAAATRPKGSSVQHIREVMLDWHSELEKRHNASSAITGLSTGLQGIDDITGGLQDGDLFVLAARPSMGKSALAGQIAHHVAGNGDPALVFSGEMPNTQFANRMVAAAASVGMSALRSPIKIESGGWDRITAQMPIMQGLPLFFDETPQIAVDQLAARARQIDAQHRLRLIVVDYLQIMRMRDPNRLVQSIGEITGTLKCLAKELKLPVLLLSQLNRGVEDRADKRPMLSDLRDSGAIEQDADVVAFLYRDEFYNPESPAKGYAEFIVRKQRNGETGTVPLVSQLGFSRFRDCAGLPEAPVAPPPRGRHRGYAPQRLDPSTL